MTQGTVLELVTGNLSCLECCNDLHLILIAEEEMKRSQERFAGSYAAVGFQYDSAGTEEANGDQQGQGRF